VPTRGRRGTRCEIALKNGIGLGENHCPSIVIDDPRAMEQLGLQTHQPS
jgi:hypothetical protein